MTLLEIAKMNEDEARTYLESLRWPNGPVCPHCQSQDVTRMEGKKHRNGAIQCNACRQQFTVTVGGVMESSKIPLVKWCMAFHLICSSKKGFSAAQLQRELGLGSYKSAWFMLHRIRHAMEQDVPDQLIGAVEVDETYVGGKPRGAGYHPRGRGTSKAPVIVLVQRDGNAVCKPVARVTGQELRGEIIRTVAKEATILTDEFSVYNGIGDHFMGGHETVNHGKKEYFRVGESGLPIHTNTAECFFSLVKRGHYGVYHQMSKKHLHRYCHEFGFRWNFRRLSDKACREAAIVGASGKRLMYR